MPQPIGKPHVSCLPFYALSAAAGDFGPPVIAECSGWVATPIGIKASDQLFVTQVIGRSMEPTIPDGSLCVFRTSVAGHRSGKILLVEHSSISDPETGCSYTVKEYQSLKSESQDSGDDSSWRHDEIKLVPHNKDFRPIYINPDHTDQIRVIAELVKVIQ